MTHTARDLAIILGAFVAASAIAALAGAANMGTALTFGQFAATIAILALILS